MPTQPKPPMPPMPPSEATKIKDAIATVITPSGTAKTTTAPSGHKFKMVFKKPDLDVGHRVLIYGKPGCGKTTMMLKGLPRPLVAFDFDSSINVLLAKPQEESGIDPNDVFLADVQRDSEGRLDYGAFLSILRDATALLPDGKTRAISEEWNGIRSVLIDTGTFAERAIEPYLFEHPETYPTGNPKKQKATSLADYSFRGGNIYKNDLYQLMLDYLGNLALCHVNVAIVYHTTVGKVPNLANADGIALEYQPDSWAAGKTSLGETAMRWCDHVGAIKDNTISDGKDGKLQRIVGRVIQFAADGEYYGKSRTLYGDAATVPLDEFNLSMLGIK